MKGTKKEGRNKTPPRANSTEMINTETSDQSTDETLEVVTTSTTSKKIKKFTPQQEAAFKELQLKFILNLPKREQESLPRLFFQLEQAHWFYEDFLADRKNSGLPHITFYDFGAQMCSYCKPLQVLKPGYKQCYEEFIAYKNLVPTYGCILLNKKCDKVLLVRNWKKTCWSFPKGKLNEGEDIAECAMREVDEEIGYRPIVNRDDHITFVNDNGQHSSMFIVPNMPENFNYQPRARKEISKIEFFDLNEPLPNEKFNFNKYKPELNKWIKNYKLNRKTVNKKDSSAQLSSSVSNLFEMAPASTTPSSLFDGSLVVMNGKAASQVETFKETEISPKSVLAGVTSLENKDKFSFKVEDVFAY